MKKEKQAVFTSQDLKELESKIESLKKEVFKKGFQELKKEKLIKNLKQKARKEKTSLALQIVKQERKNNIEKKSLKNFSIYKTNINYNSWILESYNWIKKHKEKPLNYIEFWNLESLYNSIENYTLNKKQALDLYWILKTFLVNDVNDKKYISNLWKRLTLNELVDLEKVYTYFIENIVDWKTSKARINLWYIEKLLNRIKKQESLEDFQESLEELKDFKENINNKFILEKLNTNWKIEKLMTLKEKENNIKIEYKNIRENLKEKYKNYSRKEKESLIKQEKEKAYNEYKKSICNILVQEKRIKESLKIEYYL